MFQLLGVEATKAQKSFDTTVISKVQKVGSIVPLEIRIYAVWSLNIEGGNILYNSVKITPRLKKLLKTVKTVKKNPQKMPVSNSSTNLHTALQSELLVNPSLNKSKRVFSSDGARTHTTREMKNSSLMLYQLSYQGLMLGEAILLIYILIPIFLIIFHHYLIFLETRPSWKGQ